MNLCELLLLSNPTVAHPPTHHTRRRLDCVQLRITFVPPSIKSFHICMYVQIYFPWPSSAIHHKRGYCWLGSPEHLPATSVLLFIINHTWTLRYDNNFHTTKLLLLLLIRLANVCFVLCSLKHVLCFINWSERHPSTSTRSRYLRAGGSLRQLDRVLANGSRKQYRLDSWQCTTTTGCCPP